MAGPIQLTETDFEQIKKNLVDYLKSTDKFTDYDFEGSNLSVILNLLSYQAQLNAYSINMVANESFLATSTIRNNVVSNARQIGYVPGSAKSAMTTLSMEFNLATGLNIEEVYPGGLPSTLEIKTGMAFTATSSASSYVFNVLDPYTAAVSAEGKVEFINVPVYEGTYITTSFEKDSKEFNQRFILENKNIDTSTIRVEVQEDPNKPVNVRYTRVNNYSKLDENSRKFWIEEVQEGYYELTFGDGLFGKSLMDGAKIYVDYLISSGTTANGIRGNKSFVFTGSVVDSFGGRVNVKPTITDSAPTNGAAEVESIQSIKYRAPKNFGAQARCVTKNDYETIVREIYPSIKDMYVFGGEDMNPAEYGRIYIVIKPSLGETLSNSTKRFIVNSLDDYRIASLDIKVVDPDVLYVEAISTAYYDDTKTLKDTASLRGQIINALKKYTESVGVARFGGTIKYSKIVGLIDDVDESIVRNVTSLRMRKNLIPVYETEASYEICFENPVEIDYDAAVVYSTGFKLRNDNQVYYFENIPPELGDTTSKIQRFHFDVLHEKIVDDKEFGTLDLLTGEIMLGVGNPFIISETVLDNDVIEIRSKPLNSGKEIKSEGKVYLDFDISKSSISVIVEREVY